LTEAATIPAAPIAPAEAAAQITALKADKGFFQRFTNGDVSAKTQWESLHKAAANETAVSAPGALEQLDAFKNDPAAREALANGDVAAIAKFAELNKAAFPDAPADPAAEIDQQFPAGKATDFQIGMHFKNDNGEVDAVGQAAHAQTAEWLETLRLPSSIGTVSVQAIADFQPMWQAMDENARANHAEGVRSKLNAMWGPEVTAARISMANELIREAESKKPGLIDMLQRSGAVSQLDAVMHLALHGERMFARKGVTIDAVMAKLKGA
jgi:hypothetical protein